MVKTAPNEIILEIFEKLDYRDLKSLQCVCMRFHEFLIRTSPYSSTEIDKILFRDAPTVAPPPVAKGQLANDFHGRYKNYRRHKHFRFDQLYHLVTSQEGEYTAVADDDKSVCPYHAHPVFREMKYVFSYRDDCDDGDRDSITLRGKPLSDLPVMDENAISPAVRVAICHNWSCGDELFEIYGTAQNGALTVGDVVRAIEKNCKGRMVVGGWEGLHLPCVVDGVLHFRSEIKELFHFL